MILVLPIKKCQSCTGAPDQHEGCPVQVVRAALDTPHVSDTLRRGWITSFQLLRWQKKSSRGRCWGMSLLPHLTFVWTAASPASISANFSLPRTPDRSGRARRKPPERELMIRRKKRTIFSCARLVAKRLICANSIKFFITRYLAISLWRPNSKSGLPSHQPSQRIAPHPIKRSYAQLGFHGTPKRKRANARSEGCYECPEAIAKRTSESIRIGVLSASGSSALSESRKGLLGLNCTEMGRSCDLHFDEVQFIGSGERERKRGRSGNRAAFRSPFSWSVYLGCRWVGCSTPFFCHPDWAKTCDAFGTLHPYRRP